MQSATVLALVGLLAMVQVRTDDFFHFLVTSFWWGYHGFYTLKVLCTGVGWVLRFGRLWRRLWHASSLSHVFRRLWSRVSFDIFSLSLPLSLHPHTCSYGCGHYGCYRLRARAASARTLRIEAKPARSEQAVRGGVGSYLIWSL